MKLSTICKQYIDFNQFGNTYINLKVTIFNISKLTES